MPRIVKRQGKFTPALADRICAALSEGTPLAVICREIGIDRVTAYRWAEERPELAQRIAHARDLGYDAIADRVRRTARGDASDGDSSGDVQRDKLIVETDLKLLAKWCPKRYGEALDVKHSGAVNLTISTDDASVL